MTSAHVGLADPRAYVHPAVLVRQQIAEGTLKPGQPTPSISRLSKESGHAPLTCIEALRMLKGEGLVTLIRASGTASTEVLRTAGTNGSSGTPIRPAYYARSGYLTGAARSPTPGRSAQPGKDGIAAGHGTDVG